MTQLAAWEELCSLIDDDPELWPSVLDALDTRPGADPWAALLDGLDDCGALAYLQVGDSAMELEEALVRVPRVVEAGLELEAIGDIDGPAEAAWEAVDGLLEPAGLALLTLEEEPDALPLIIVPRASAGRIMALAAHVGHAAQALPASSADRA